jgi:calcineurin-like phosphoesterase family protein
MSKKDETYIEMSKRIDSAEEDIFILRDRFYKQDETQGVVVAAVERLSDQIMTVFENQDKFSEKVIETFKDHAVKFKDIEDTTNNIKIVTSHWKTIVWMIIISCAIGFAFDNGIKDILRVLAGNKVAAVVSMIG